IIWTTEFMFNAKRARYTEIPLYKYFLHGASVSRLPRTGLKNLAYQRHYIKITRLLDKMNHDYAGRIPIYPEFKQQVIYEALRVCHCIRKEPDEKIRQRMIAEVFVSGMFKRMVSNICSVKLGYQVLLWAIRFSQWRDKSLTPRRLAHLTLDSKG
ncbi:glycosyltransferase, partial [Citrobacter freundii]